MQQRWSTARVRNTQTAVGTSVSLNLGPEMVNNSLFASSHSTNPPKAASRRDTTRWFLMLTLTMCPSQRRRLTLRLKSSSHWESQSSGSQLSSSPNTRNARPLKPSKWWWSKSKLREHLLLRLPTNWDKPPRRRTEMAPLRRATTTQAGTSDNLRVK